MSAKCKEMYGVEYADLKSNIANSQKEAKKQRDKKYLAKYRKENQEKITQYKRENKEKIKEQKARYYQENRETIRGTQNEYWLRNRHILNARRKKKRMQKNRTCQGKIGTKHSEMT